MSSEKRPCIDSREYKVMLDATRFIGDTEDLSMSCSQFWKACSRQLDELGLKVKGDLDKRRTPRLIRFFDTQVGSLRQQGYVFRERVTSKSGKREVTMKFRHPDRYVANERHIQPRKGNSIKFEQDLKPLFPDRQVALYSLYSYSASQLIGRNKNLNRLDDPLDLYSGLKKDLMGKIGRVDRAVTQPGPSQIRTCPIKASGSSKVSFAQ